MCSDFSLCSPFLFLLFFVMTVETLYEQLKRLGLREGQPHAVFGEWEKVIETQFVKQMYLEKKRGDKVGRNGKALVEYR